MDTLLLLAALIAQVAWGWSRPDPVASASALDLPPPIEVIRVASIGEPIAAAQWLTLSLQSYDNQPGVSIPFLDLDYARVSAWLGRILEMDPNTQYPLLMAAQLYAQVPDRGKQRAMLDFVRQQFPHDPDRRWRYLAHMAIMAKHRLNDLPLALACAQDIQLHATAPNVPDWARQMNVFLLEDMGEYARAKILLGGLLASGTITDPHEMHFLMERLDALNAKAK
jgi:hypothetical protein